MLPLTSKGNLIALCLVFSSGFSGTMALPFWFGAIITNFNIENWMAGSISALYFFGIFLGSFILSSYMHRANKRITAVLGMCLACLGFITTIYAESTALLTVSMPISGVGLGMGLASTTTTIGKMANSQKTFSIVHMAVVLYAILFFFTVPPQIVVYGLRAIFIALALTTAIAGIIAFMMFPDIRRRSNEKATEGASQDKVIIPVTSTTYLILGAITAFYIGQNGIWSFVERVGVADKLTIHEIGQILLTGAIFNILGPLAARWLGKRFGVILPILGAIATLCVVSLIFFSIQSQTVFIMGVILIPLITLFSAPYVYEYVATIDNSGRASALAPGFIMIGCGIGSAFAGTVASAIGLKYLGASACIPLIISAVIYFVTGMRKSHDQRGGFGSD